MGGGIREHFPTVKKWATVPSRCLYCCAELAVGDEVITRRFVTEGIAIEPGKFGKIASIASAPDGSVYVVVLDEGAELTVPRPAIRLLRPNEAKASLKPH
jgi:hypothetical protein